MNRRTFLRRLTAAAAATSCGTLFAADSSPRVGRLAEHRIAAIEFKRVRLHWPRLVGKNSRLDVHGRGPTLTVCILETNQGATGWGMIRGNVEAVRRIEDRVTGKAVSELFAPEIGITSEDLSPLDFALHDLAGVILDQPVWRMLGREEPIITKVYSGMIYFDDLEPADNPAGIEKVLEECRWDRNHGYRQLKVKIGRGNKWMPAKEGLARDIEVVKAVAKAVPDCEILVDGNDGFTVDSMIEFLQGIEGIPLFWIEEPFRETVSDWRKLHEWMRSHGYGQTYRADGEASPDYAALEPLCAEGVLNMRLEDIVGYGLTRWRALMPTLVKQGVAASPHAWGEGLKTVYIAHLAGGLGNTPTIEGVTCSDEDVDFGENRVVDGKFQLSREPGFGMKLRDV